MEEGKGGGGGAPEVDVCLQWLSFSKLRYTPTFPTNPAVEDDEAHTLLPHGIMCVSFQLGFGTSARNLKQDVITMDISRSWLERRKTRDGPEGSGATDESTDLDDTSSLMDSCVEIEKPPSGAVQTMTIAICTNG